MQHPAETTILTACYSAGDREQRHFTKIDSARKSWSSFSPRNIKGKCHYKNHGWVYHYS